MENRNHEEVPIQGHTYKWVDLQITDPDKTYSVIYELDKTIGTITGIKLSADNEPLLFGRGSLKLEINRLEVIPEGYEAKELYATVNVAVNARYLRIARIPAGNGQVKFQYADTSNALTPFAPYRVRLNMECELKDFQV